MKVFKPSNNPITQGYSTSHKGYDFAGNNQPDEVMSVLDGEIIERVDEYTTNWSNTGTLTTRDYGNYIKVKHTDGSFALFAHLRKGSSFVVGTKVKQGQTIARIGNTGNSTGSHLHFELRNTSNVNVNPEFVQEPMATITQKELDEIRLARDQHYNDLQESKKTIENLNKTIENKESELNLANTQVSTLEKELLLLKQENKMLLEQAKQVPIMTAELTTCEADRKTYLEENESLRRSVSQKDRRYEELVGNAPKLFLEWVLKRFKK